MDFKVQLAGMNIGISSQYDSLKEFCKDYVIETDEEVAFDVHSSLEEIKAENDYTEEYQFPMEYLETLATQRKIADQMPKYDRILMHGACISFQDKGYFFTAPSGTGKTTHISLWRKYLKQYVDIVNGDKPFISIDQQHNETHCRIYGTPWAGKEGWHRNCDVELGAICIVARGEENKITKVEPKTYLSYLLKQVYVPQDPVVFIKVLELVDRLLKQVPVYYLECDMSEEAVRCSFEAMTGLHYNDWREQYED